MNRQRPTSPCFHYCKLDQVSGRCIGCGHNYDEILLWQHLPEVRRDEAKREAKAFLSGRKGEERRPAAS